MKIESKIELGQKVKDEVTGFEGIAECITVWRFGCVRIGIRPQTLDKDGNVREVVFFDEPQVEIVKDTPDKKTRKAHGPKMDEVNRYSIKDRKNL